MFPVMITRKSFIALLAAILAATAAHAAADKTSSLTSNYITWTFDKEYPVGQFINGDWYVVGNPVKIVAITNTLSDPAYLDLGGAEHSGSMVNPVVDKTNDLSTQWQGYESRDKSYKPELNAARPNGKPLSKDNPLVLAPGSSLISMVSWLWRSPDDKEPGCPGVPASGLPRPSQRAAAVLTTFAEAPPAGSFRPPSAGTEKRMFNASQVKRDRLLNLAPAEGIYSDISDLDELRVSSRVPSWANERNQPVSTLPGKADEHTLYWSYMHGVNIPLLIRGTARPWIDHIPDWYAGTYLKPSINVSNYGREMCLLLESAMVALHADWSKIPGAPATKDELMNNMIQIGIDYAGCADTGTFWPGNGGHHGGRKPAILFAALLLDDEHMKSVGKWDTRFQENDYTMYVSQEMVDKSHSDAWRPDPRGAHLAPYAEFLIGMPEWQGANAGWSIPYRDANDLSFVGFALTFLMMEDGRKLFNHEPFFDYTDRSQSLIKEVTKKLPAMRAPAYVQNMWDTYRKNYPSTYDKAKWDAPAVIEWCTTPVFTLKAAPKAYGIFEIKDDEPIRMTTGTDVDLSKVTPATVKVTSKEGELTVAAIDIPENPGKYFIIKFAEGTELKPKIEYHVTLDETASADWRNGVGMKLFRNTTKFTVR